MTTIIPNETDTPDRAPRKTNSIESGIMRATEKEGLQTALDHCRENYTRFMQDDDDLGKSTQQRLAQFIHQRARELGFTLS